MEEKGSISRCNIELNTGYNHIQMYCAHSADGRISIIRFSVVEERAVCLGSAVSKPCSRCKCLSSPALVRSLQDFSISA